jgi:hypothetical protein
MDIFINHMFDWMVLILLIVGAIYTMKVIGQEKSTFRNESYLVSFADLCLMIPNWWTITEQNEQSLKFERTDTRYDWYALFQYFPDHQDKTMPQLLEDKLNLEKIEFDEDVVFETDSRVIFRDSEVQEKFQEVIRVEGKGSQDVIDRIYYDIYVMRGLEDKGYYIFESKSSVLNGALEGPYFEESLAELSLIHET